MSLIFGCSRCSCRVKLWWLHAMCEVSPYGRKWPLLAVHKGRQANPFRRGSFYLVPTCWTIDAVMNICSALQG